MTTTATTATATAADAGDSRIRGAFNGATTFNQFLCQGPTEPFESAVLRMCVMAFCFPASLGAIYAGGHSLHSVLTGDRAQLGLSNGRPLGSFTHLDAQTTAAMLAITNLLGVVLAADAHARAWWAAPGRMQSHTAQAIGQQLVWLRLMVSSHLGFMAKRNPGGLYMCYRHGSSARNATTLGPCIAARPPGDEAYGPRGPLAYLDHAWLQFAQRARSRPADQCAVMLDVVCDLVGSLAQKAVGRKAAPSPYENDRTLRCGLTPANFAQPTIDADGLAALCALWTAAPLDGGDSPAQLVDACIALPAGAGLFAGRAPSDPVSPAEAHLHEFLSRLRNHQIAPTMQRNRPPFTDPLYNGTIARICDWLDDQPLALRHYYSLLPDNRDMAGIDANLTPAQRALYGFVAGCTPEQVAGAQTEGARDTQKPRRSAGGASSAPKRRRGGRGRQSPLDMMSPPGYSWRAVGQDSGDSTPAHTPSAPAEEEEAPLPWMALSPGQLMLDDQSPCAGMWMATRDERRRQRQAHHALLRAAVFWNPVFGQATALRALFAFCRAGSPFAALRGDQAAMRALAETLRTMLPPMADGADERLASALCEELCSVVSLQKLTYRADAPDACAHIGVGALDASATGAGAEDAPPETRSVVQCMVETPEALARMVSEWRTRSRPHVVLRALFGGPQRKWSDAAVLRDMFCTMWSADPTAYGRRALAVLWPCMRQAYRELCQTWLQDWPLMMSEQDRTRHYTEQDVAQLVERLMALTPYTRTALAAETTVTAQPPPPPPAPVLVLVDEPAPVAPPPMQMPASLNTSTQWSPSGSPAAPPAPRPTDDIWGVPRPTARNPMAVVHLTMQSLMPDDDGLFPFAY